MLKKYDMRVFPNTGSYVRHNSKLSFLQFLYSAGLTSGCKLYLALTLKVLFLGPMVWLQKSVL